MSDDLLWRSATGDNALWLMNGTSFGSYAGLNPVDANWKIKGCADFNNDGKSDILWRNSSTGQSTIWLMNGSVFSSSVSLNSVDASWDIKGAGDFNGDGKADILWRKNTGQNGIWLMNGTTYSGYAGLNSVDTSWNIKGVGDFNSDGKSDIIWRKNTGENGIWLMNGTSFGSYAGLNSVDTSWDIKGAGDFNGDGKSDIIWRKNTGDNGIWLMNNSVFSSYVGLNSVSTNWDIVGAGNFSSSSSPITDIDGNGSFATAGDLGVLSGTRSGQGVIGGSTDNFDYYRFSLNNVSTFNLSLTGLSQNADVTLYDTNGNFIVSSSNSNATPESINGLLEPGTYFARVSSFNSPTNYNLSLTATPTSIGGDGAGNDFVSARNLGNLTGSSSFQDFVGSSDSLDYYRFSLSNVSTFNLSLTGLSKDANVTLYDTNGNFIVSSSNSNTTPESINGLLEPGTYYVRVSNFNSFSGNTIYNLGLSATPTSIGSDRAGNSFTSARNLGNLSGSLSFQDFVGFTDSLDFYRFSLTSARNFSLNLSGLVQNADVTLYDTNENFIVSSSNSGITQEQINQFLSSGTYYVRVSNFNSFFGNTTYNLSLFA